MTTWRNWGRTAACEPIAIEHPEDETELARLVVDAAAQNRTVRAVGSGHSFTAIACTNSVMVDLDGFRTPPRIDDARQLATLPAGMLLHDANKLLAAQGWAMTNLGDIAYQTLAGATSTGTHGTGVGFGGLSTQLRGFRLATAGGDVLDCDVDHNREVFDLGRIGLGALGVMTEATIAVEPAFRLHAIEEPRPIGEVLDGWVDLVETSDHFEFFWIPGTRRAMTKSNQRTSDDPQPLSRLAYARDKILGENVGFGAVCWIGRHRPSMVPRLSKLISGAPSRLEYVDDSYKVFASPRWVRFAEMEYSIPLADLPTVVRRIADAVEQHQIDLLFPIEARTAAADDIALSTSFDRRSAYVAVHRAKGREYRPYFELVEAICREHDGRPHWGKLHFRAAADLAPMYPRWDEFLALRDRLDPQRVFANQYLTRVLG